MRRWLLSRGVEIFSVRFHHLPLHPSAVIDGNISSPRHLTILNNHINASQLRYDSSMSACNGKNVTMKWRYA